MATDTPYFGLGADYGPEYDSADPDQYTLQRELLDFYPWFMRELPSDAIFKQWLGVHQDHLDSLAAEIAKVKQARSIDFATGVELDLHGATWGRLGRRRGRGDGEYRQFLKTLDAAFSGIGRQQDIETAVAAVAVVDSEFVHSPEYRHGIETTDGPGSTLDRPLTNDEGTAAYGGAPLEYGLRLFDWGAHPPGGVRDLADLADPAAIALRDPVEYWGDDSSGLTLGGGQATVSRTTTATPIVLGGGDGRWQKVQEGLGAGTLDSGQTIERVVSSPYTVSDEETVSGKLTVTD